jgi:hypothetical protein
MDFMMDPDADISMDINLYGDIIYTENP